MADIEKKDTLKQYSSDPQICGSVSQPEAAKMLNVSERICQSTFIRLIRQLAYHNRKPLIENGSPERIAKILYEKRPCYFTWQGLQLL